MDNKNDLSHDEMLADSIFYDELDEESSYESDGGTKDLPKIVRGELDRRRRLRSASARGAPQDSCSDADADSRDDTKLKELEQPASPEIVEAFKNHVKEGSFGPHLYGGYLTIMEVRKRVERKFPSNLCAFESMKKNHSLLLLHISLFKNWIHYPYILLLFIM